ncbi:hypothetical protein TSUD_253820 [Trifolium subterraneum]|uniref:EF-hand domain-containing protein n=1 Tax=Trifolium subterraneum TaxID=3900 RepID=A0A2Z6PHL6_TRISU|nr:hypothetical protein TSUD_253820 [Trifolium subterraneum]
MLQCVGGAIDNNGNGKVSGRDLNLLKKRRHENELNEAANQPLPDDDDDAFE